MHTLEPRADRAPFGGPLGRFLGGWNDFWFRPADPTGLGFLRIIVGCLILYVHACYTLDLNDFFGEHSWYDLKGINTARREQPIAKQPWTWDEVQLLPLRLPDEEQRRRVVLEWMRTLPESVADRERSVQFLRMLPGEPLLAAECLVYADKLADDPANLERNLKLLAERPQEAKNPLVPAALVSAPEAARKQAPGDLRALVSVLGNDMLRRKLVILWFSQLSAVDTGPLERARALTFITGGPDGRGLPAGRAERDKVIDYILLWNIHPTDLLAKGAPLWSVWFHVTEPSAVRAVHFGILAVMVLFTLGFCTRVTALLTWLSVVSYIHRSDVVLFGMDTMMNILLIYLVVAPSGAALSVDRLIARYRAARAGQRGEWPARRVEAFLSGPPKLAAAQFATRLIQIHFCIIYAASGFSKLKGNAWWQTTATWTTLANPEFCPTHLAVYDWFLRTLAYSRPACEMYMLFGVVFTLFVEIGTPFLIWRPRWRPVMILLSALLHAGISFFMGLTMFSLFMLCFGLMFIPVAAVRARFARGPEGLPRLRFGYDVRDPRQARRAALLRALDVAGQLELSPHAKPGEPAALAVDDEPTGGGRGAFRAALGRLWLARPLSWALGASAKAEAPRPVIAG